MFGFDNYIPSKWLDGVLAVHLATPVAVVARAFRGGKWAAKATVSAAFLVGGVMAASAELLPAQTVEVVRTVPEEGAQDSHRAPPGYFGQLEAAIAKTTRLAEQSTASDPDFFF